MKTQYVIVKDYDPAWNKNFEMIKQELNEALSDIIISVEHVGSTSVYGLAAKPIIDIDIIIESNEILNEFINRLTKIGYIYEGDLGIKDRYAFKYEDKKHLQTHHLYVCPKDSEELKRHIALRDFLRTSPEYRQEYSNIKKEAAKLFPNDIDKYIEYKSNCINEIYKKCIK